MRVMIATVAVLGLIASYLAGRATRPEDFFSLPSDLVTFEKALIEADPLDHAFHYNAFMQKLGPEHIDSVADLIESHRLWLSGEELQNFFLAWVKFDAPGALKWAMADNRPGRFKQRVGPAAIFAWGYHDPSSALIGFRSRPSSKLTPVLHEQLIAGWVLREDTSEVAKYIGRMGPTSVRQKAISALTTELMRDGSDAVIAWVESIPDKSRREYKTVAFQKAANALTIEDPVATARWIEGHLDRPYSSEAPNAIGRRWVEQDPIPAMEWLAGLPEGEAKDLAVSAGYRQWHSKAAADAEVWLRAETPREGLDQAVRVMVRQDSESTPTAAIEWASRIENEDRRDRVLRSVVKAWYKRDPEDADAWMQQSGLPPEIQAEIRSRTRGKASPSGKIEAPAPSGG